MDIGEKLKGMVEGNEKCVQILFGEVIGRREV
jgi:hypothetical protein